MDLAGAVCIVTGGGSGLGAVVAAHLAAKRARVVVVDRYLSAAKEAVAELQSVGADALPIEADVCDDSAAAAAVDRAVAWGGRVDCLVNNAGGWADAADNFPVSAIGTWSGALDLNLRAPMLLIQTCLPHMERVGGGAVVNVASSAAIGSSRYPSPEYAAAKAGLIRLTTALGRIEPAGVRVNAVVPGWVGLPRAHREWAELSTHEQESRAALVPPELVGQVIAELLVDTDRAGWVVELPGGRERRALPPDGD